MTWCGVFRHGLEGKAARPRSLLKFWQTIKSEGQAGRTISFNSARTITQSTRNFWDHEDLERAVHSFARSSLEMMHASRRGGISFNVIRIARVVQIEYDAQARCTH